MELQLIIAAFLGGCASLVGYAWWTKYQKEERLRVLKGMAKSAQRLANKEDDSSAEAAEAEKRAVDERRFLKELQDAVKKL